MSTSPGAKAQVEPCHKNLLTIIGISELAEASLDDIPLVLEYRPDFVTVAPNVKQIFLKSIENCTRKK